MIDNLVSHHRILGIDPGTLFMGWAILDTEGQKVSIVDFNVLDVHKLDGQYPRLQKEFFFLQELIDTYHPTSLAIETQFVDKNPQTMIKIVHAQGVAIAAALNGFIFRKISTVEKLLLIAGGLTLLVPGTVTDIVGIVLVAAVIAMQKLIPAKAR